MDPVTALLWVLVAFLALSLLGGVLVVALVVLMLVRGKQRPLHLHPDPFARYIPNAKRNGHDNTRR